VDSACDTEDSDEDASEESMVEDSDSSEREEESVCDDSEAAELVTEVAIVARASIDDIWSLLTLPAGKRTVGSSNGGVSFGIGPVGAAKPLGRGASSRRK